MLLNQNMRYLLACVASGCSLALPPQLMTLSNCLAQTQDAADEPLPYHTVQHSIYPGTSNPPPSGGIPASPTHHLAPLLIPTSSPCPARSCPVARQHSRCCCQWAFLCTAQTTTSPHGALRLLLTGPCTWQRQQPQLSGTHPTPSPRHSRHWPTPG
jgi:hypothetical protein